MRKLGRTSAQRKAMLRGMTTLLLEKGKIETTYTRAQEVSAKADEMITLGKKGDLAAYRAALAYITKEDVAKKLFSVIAPTYQNQNGGYTRVLKTGARRGDAAEMAIVTLVKVEAPVAEEPKKAAKTAKKTTKTPAKKAAKAAAPAEEAPVAEAPVEEAAPVAETAPAEAEAPATETAE